MDDVLILGAGPAGTTAAWELARLGYRVTLLERESLPRAKPCAGALAAKAWPYLPPGLLRPTGSSYRGLILEYEGREVGRVEEGEPYAVPVERSHFDLALARHAAAAGARILDGERVTRLDTEGPLVQARTEGGRRYVGRFVIGADGAAGISRRHLGLLPLRRGAALAGQVSGIAMDPGSAVVEFAVPHGYAWIFPKEGHLSVGVATMIPERIGLRRLLKDFWERRLGLVAGVHVAGHPVAIGDGRGPWTARLGLVAGDAAGLCEPLTGEGLYYALASGRLAAQAARAFLAGSRDWAKEYRLALAGGLGGNLAWAAKAARLFYGLPQPWRAKLLVQPPLAQAFLRTVAAADGYREAYGLLVAALPGPLRRAR